MNKWMMLLLNMMQQQKAEQQAEKQNKESIAQNVVQLQLAESRIRAAEDIEEMNRQNNLDQEVDIDLSGDTESSTKRRKRYKIGQPSGGLKNTIGL